MITTGKGQKASFIQISMEMTWRLRKDVTFSLVQDLDMLDET